MASKKSVTGHFGSTVTTVNIDGVMVHVYYPTPNAFDSSCVQLVITAPFYLVFGDGRMTPEECIIYANDTGLAELAAQNGSVINFVQPKGDDWNDEADKDSYETMVTHIDFDSSHNYINGISNQAAFFFGEIAMRVMGSSEMIYVYGLGSGADLIARNWLRKVIFLGVLKDERDYTITGATLEKLSDISNLVENRIPLVSVNNSDEVNEALKKANINGRFMIANDRDFKAQAKQLANVYRRQSGTFIERTDYEKLGIVEKRQTFKVPTAKENSGVSEEFNSIAYITYYSKDLDLELNGEKVPLVITCHGVGNNAIYQAYASEWPIIGKENGFITVSLDNHIKNPASEIIALIEHLKKVYPIDPTRIYVSGFSMGALKTWDLLQQYAEVFAGFAPMHAGFGKPYRDSYMQKVLEINTKLVVPLFYVGGEKTSLPEFPFGKGLGGGENTFPELIDFTFKVNGVPREYHYNKEENPWWGIAADLYYQVTDRNTFTDSVLSVNLFKSANGRFYTAYANASNEQHEIFGRNSRAAWDFLKQFKRQPNGSIEIVEADYKLLSDDGSLSGNSYNR